MDDFGKALESLKGMLETEEGRNTLNSLVGSLTGSSGGSSSEPAAQDVPVQANNVLSNIPVDTIGRYGELLTSIRGSSNAPRMQLMSALKPYLSTKRQQKYDVIMNLMKYSDIPSALFGRHNKK